MIGIKSFETKLLTDFFLVSSDNSIACSLVKTLLQKCPSKRNRNVISSKCLRLKKVGLRLVEDSKLNLTTVSSKLIYVMSHPFVVPRGKS